jgi:hypothetical protein
MIDAEKRSALRRRVVRLLEGKLEPCFQKPKNCLPSNFQNTPPENETSSAGRITVDAREKD